jgi:hypothetical protein
MHLKTGRNILRTLDSSLAPEALNQAKLIAEIKRHDNEIGSKFEQFSQAYEAYLFVKQDFELRSKLKEIWEFQCKSLKDKAISSFDALKTLLKQKNIAVEGLETELL